MTYTTLESEVLDRIERPAGSSDLDEAAFNALALAIHRFQRENNEPYRKYCEFQRVPPPEALTNWRDIPAVPTAAFRHAPLRTFAEAETIATFRTSGTTGEGFGCHPLRSFRLYDASILRAWESLPIPPLPLVVLTQCPSDAPHSSLCHMMGVLATASEWALGTPAAWCLNADGKLDLPAFRGATMHGPVLVLGTALAFLHLFEQLGGEHLPLAPGSFAMETGGYKGTGRSLSKAALYTRFFDSLELAPDSIFNEYSMTELSSQWYTHGLGRPHRGPAWARALVVNPAGNREVPEGEQGVLRLFDLANLGSVVAIQTQVLAVRRGDAFELIGRNPGAVPRGCSRTADEMLQAGQ